MAIKDIYYMVRNAKEIMSDGGDFTKSSDISFCFSYISADLTMSKFLEPSSHIQPSHVLFGLKIIVYKNVLK